MKSEMTPKFAISHREADYQMSMGSSFIVRADDQSASVGETEKSLLNRMQSSRQGSICSQLEVI